MKIQLFRRLWIRLFVFGTSQVSSPVITHCLKPRISPQKRIDDSQVMGRERKRKLFKFFKCRPSFNSGVAARDGMKGRNQIRLSICYDDNFCPGDLFIFLNFFLNLLVTWFFAGAEKEQKLLYKRVHIKFRTKSNLVLLSIYFLHLQQLTLELRCLGRVFKKTGN